MLKEIVKSLKEYPVTLLHSLIRIVPIILGVLGFLDLVIKEFQVPLWGWGLATLSAVLIAQFFAFHSVRIRRDELQYLIQRGLKIEFSNSRDSFHHRVLSARYNGGINYGHETYRVAVTNTGSQTIRNVDLELVEIEPKPQTKVFFKLPLRLHLTKDCSRDIKPGGELFFNVVIYHLHTPDQIMINQVESNTIINIPLGVYTLTLRATGEDKPSAVRKFKVHTYNERLYMFPEGESTIELLEGRA